MVLWGLCAVTSRSSNLTLSNNPNKHISQNVVLFIQINYQHIIAGWSKVSCHWYFLSKWIILWSSISGPGTDGIMLHIITEKHELYHMKLLKIVLFEKDLHWRYVAVTQNPCSEQVDNYRLFRRTHKTKQQHKQRTCNTTQRCRHSHTSPNSLELFDLCSRDSLLCIDQLQRWRIHRKTHTWQISWTLPTC